MLKFGNNNIGKMFFGSNSIGKAYYGSNLVFQLGSSPTPGEETLLHYIEFNGAYLDTGIIPDQDTRVVCDFYQMPKGFIYQYLFGARTAFTNNDFTFTSQRTSGHTVNPRSVFGDDVKQFGAATSPLYRHRCRVDYNNSGAVSITRVDTNTVLQTMTHPTSTFTPNVNLYLGAMNDNGSVSGGTDVRIYEFLVYQSGVLVMDLLPYCSGNRVYFKDSVSGNTFTPIGTCVAGPVASESPTSEVLPAGYTRLNYILNTSSGYINTGIIPDETTTIVGDLCLDQSSTDGWQHFWGARIAYASSDFSFTPRDNQWTEMRFVRGSEECFAASTTQNAIARFLHVEQSPTGYSAKDYNGDVLFSGTFSNSDSFTPNLPIYLFTYNNNGSPTSSVTIARALIYRVKIYSGETLVGDFVPAKNGSDVVGLFDLVGQSFYGSETQTASFTAGPELSYNSIFVI